MLILLCIFGFDEIVNLCNHAVQAWTNLLFGGMYIQYKKSIVSGGGHLGSTGIKL